MRKENEHARALRATRGAYESELPGDVQEAMLDGASAIERLDTALDAATDYINALEKRLRSISGPLLDGDAEKAYEAAL